MKTCYLSKSGNKDSIDKDENKRSEKCCTNLIWYAIIKTAFELGQEYQNLNYIRVFSADGSALVLLRLFSLIKTSPVNKIRREAMF